MNWPVCVVWPTRRLGSRAEDAKTARPGLAPSARPPPVLRPSSARPPPVLRPSSARPPPVLRPSSARPPPVLRPPSARAWVGALRPPTQARPGLAPCVRRPGCSLSMPPRYDRERPPGSSPLLYREGGVDGRLGWGGGTVGEARSVGERGWAGSGRNGG
jgi:hypothetical protein